MILVPNIKWTNIKLELKAYVIDEIINNILKYLFLKDFIEGNHLKWTFLMNENFSYYF